jgi:hypothetical protein
MKLEIIVSFPERLTSHELNKTSCNLPTTHTMSRAGDITGSSVLSSVQCHVLSHQPVLVAGVELHDSCIDQAESGVREDRHQTF